VNRTGWLCVLAASSCAANPRGPMPEPRLTSSSRPRLALSKSEFDELPEDLRIDLKAKLHHYYRYVARRFAALACELGVHGPVVNLHGDAHIEQYLVTSLGRGLGDFDEATTGPVDVDLLRLAVSIRLVAAERGWNADRLWSHFRAGYVRALMTPDWRCATPRFAVRAAASFRRDHGALLDWSMSLMQPVSEAVALEIKRAIAAFAEQQIDGGAQLGASAFEVVKVGRHDLGVASRASVNYLLRTRGQKRRDPSDDMIFEAKAATSNPAAWCLPLSGEPDAERILVGEKRLAYTTFRYMGQIEVEGRSYWLHEWVDDYHELSAEDPTLDEALMREVVTDIGAQLGLGHPRLAETPARDELRLALLRFLGAEQQALWTQAQRLDEEVRRSWGEIQSW
jgi:hypothetical protein